MELKEFQDIVERDTGIEILDNDEANIALKMIYNLRKHNPEQKAFTYVDGLAGYINNKVNLDALKKYGVLDTKTEEVLYTYDYVCIIPKEVLDNQELLLYIDKFNKRFLEEGYHINGIFLDYNLEDINDYNILTETLKNLPYRVTILNVKSNVQNNLIRAKVVTAKIEEYKARRFNEFIDITDYVEKLEKSFNGNQENTLKIFQEVTDMIRSRHAENRNLVVYSYRESQVYSIIAAHCNYYNASPIEFIFNNSSGEYRTKLTELYYDSERMLLCDRIRYLQHLPSIMFRVTDFGPSVLFIESKRIKANAYVTGFNSIRLAEEDVVTIEEIDFSEDSPYEIIPFDEEYSGLNSGNLDEIKAEDRRCRNDLNIFYYRLKKKFQEDNSGSLQILNPCNTILLKHKKYETVYIAYIKSDDDIHLAVKGEQIALPLPVLKFKKVEMGLDTIKYWFPYNASIDLLTIVKSINKALRGKLNKYVENLEPPYMNREEMTTVFRYLYISNNKERINDFDRTKYIELLLNNINSVLFRRDDSPLYGINFEEEILPRLDCFGGLNVVTTRSKYDKIRLTENTFRR